MNVCETKQDFMNELGKELTRFGVVDTGEIISDFEQHFTAGKENGQTEREVCAKLGSIEEIAKQYVDDDVIAQVTEKEKTQQNAAFGNDYQQPEQQYQQPEQQYQQNNNQNNQYSTNNQYSQNNQYNNQYNQSTQNTACQSQFKADGLVCCLLLDIFVLSWAIPTLFSLVIAYLSIPIALIASGLGTLIAGIVSIFVRISFFSTPFAPLSSILLGIAVIALGGLAVLLGIVIVKGFVAVIKALINWHGMMIVGKEVIHSNKVKAGATV